MKKQITFYIVWDVLFIVFLRLYNVCGVWMKGYYNDHYKSETINFIPSTLMEFGLLVVIGAFVSWLVYISFQFKFTRKLALIEFLIIGITSLYLASIMLLPYSIIAITGDASILEHLPLWLYWLHFSQSTLTYLTIGGLLFGYELIIFIIRMVICKNIDNASELE